MAKARARVPEHVEDDWDYLVQPGRVHRDLYTDGAVFRREVRQVFGGTWVYLGHETEIPQPHDFVTRRMGLRPLILTRDGSGVIHALLNRCTHRGAQVCREARGNRKFFSCGYHMWTFRSDGACATVPQPGAYGPDFRLGDMNLGKVPRVESYRGFVFGTLNPDTPALTEHLAGAREHLDWWIDRNGEFAARANVQRYTVNSNWKCLWDNAGDGYHPNYSHQSLLSVRTRRYGRGIDMTYFGADTDKGPMYALALGNGHTLIDQRPEMYSQGRSAWDGQPPQPGREACEARLVADLGREQALALLHDNMGAGMNLNIFPNLMLVGNQIETIEPVAVNCTQMTWHVTIRDDVPAAVNTMRLRSQEDFPMFGEPDDTGNFESCQLGMAIPEMEWIDISRHMDKDVPHEQATRAGKRQPVSSDIHMRHYYSEWKRLMRADLELTVG